MLCILGHVQTPGRDELLNQTANWKWCCCLRPSLGSSLLSLNVSFDRNGSDLSLKCSFLRNSDSALRIVEGSRRLKLGKHEKLLNFFILEQVTFKFCTVCRELTSFKSESNQQLYENSWLLIIDRDSVPVVKYLCLIQTRRQSSLISSKVRNGKRKGDVLICS